jgi:hypothetical protein
MKKIKPSLKRLIAERRAAADQKLHVENMRWRNAIDHYKTAQEMGLAFDPAEIGFEFSTEEIIARDQQRFVEAAIRSGRYYEHKKNGTIKTQTTGK